MLEQVTKPIRDTLPDYNKTHLAVGSVVFGALLLAGQTATQTTPPEVAQLSSQIRLVGLIITAVVVAVAIPNGAYGFLQYMTAGSNVDQDEKGRQRIRQTFIALAGVGMLQIAVQAIAAALGV